jgi:hypothetical protein
MPCSNNLHLRQSASICGQFRIRLRLAALGCGESFHGSNRISKYRNSPLTNRARILILMKYEGGLYGVRELAPAFASGTLPVLRRPSNEGCADQSGGKPPHSKDP